MARQRRWFDDMKTAKKAAKERGVNCWRWSEDKVGNRVVGFYVGEELPTLLNRACVTTKLIMYMYG